MKAFPHTYDKTQPDGRVATITQSGMELRDYFAIEVLPVFLSDVLPETKKIGKDKAQEVLALACSVSYKIADMMMEARKL